MLNPKGLVCTSRWKFWTGINREWISSELKKQEDGAETLSICNLRRKESFTCCMLVPEGLLSSSSWRRWLLLSACRSWCWSCRNCSLGTMAQPCCWSSRECGDGLSVTLALEWSIWRAKAGSCQVTPIVSRETSLNSVTEATQTTLSREKKGASLCALLNATGISALMHHFSPEL